MIHVELFLRNSSIIATAKDDTTTVKDDAKARTRQRILEAAADILEGDGASAVSTRSVAAAAALPGRPTVR